MKIAPCSPHFKYGVIDGVADYLLPDGDFGRVGTGLATRLTPIGAILDTHTKIMEDPFLEVIGGPSAQIAGSIYSAASGAVNNLIHGRSSLLTEDVIKILRQPSGIDNVFKAAGIFANGEYRSKNGISMPAEMSPTEGVLQLFGVGSLKQTEWYENKKPYLYGQQEVP